MPRLSSIVALAGLVAPSSFAQLERVPPDTKVASTSIEELARAIEDEADDARPRTIVIDVRLEEDFASEPVLIPRASWRNPHEIEAWAKELSPETPVVVYCVRGYWVSQSVTKKLSDLGLQVSQLTGGIEAWKASGRPTSPAER